MMAPTLSRSLPMSHYLSLRFSVTDRSTLKPNCQQVISNPIFSSHHYHVINSVLPDTGNYSRLSVEILFARSCGYYLIQVYLPAALIVVISWSSFWLDRGDTDRGATLLTMTMLIVSTNASLPKISYIKAIDVYLSACFIMVFASLLGTADLQLRILLGACI